MIPECANIRIISLCHCWSGSWSLLLRSMYNDLYYDDDEDGDDLSHKLFINFTFWFKRIWLFNIHHHIKNEMDDRIRDIAGYQTKKKFYIIYLDLDATNVDTEHIIWWRWIICK